MDGHTHQLTADHATVCTQQIEHVQTAQCIGLTAVQVHVHLVQGLAGIVPFHLVDVLEEEVTVLDGMIARLPLVDGVRLRCPATSGHLLVVIVIVVRDSVVGSHVSDGRTIVRQHQEGVVNQTTGKCRVVIHLRDVLNVLQCRGCQVVAGGEGCGSTAADQTCNKHILHIIDFHILSLLEV